MTWCDGRASGASASALRAHELGNILFVLRARLGLCKYVGRVLSAFEVNEAHNFVLDLFNEVTKACKKVTDLVMMARAFLRKCNGAGVVDIEGGGIHLFVS